MFPHLLWTTDRLYFLGGDLKEHYRMLSLVCKKKITKNGINYEISNG